MGKRLAKWISSRRELRLKRLFAISPFTIFLLGFGLVYWMFHIFTIVTTVECEYAVMWINGWFEFKAPFQILGGAIALCAFVWFLRVLLLRSLRKIENAVQLLFIIGLLGAYAAQKAYLFPHGFPDRTNLEQVTSLMGWRSFRLYEEDQVLRDVREDWPFDYPLPPFAHRPEPPWWRTTELLVIFPSADSPTYTEYKSMHACYAAYREASAHYEEDIKRWNAYWEEFRQWHAGNAWRYPDKPSPYYWR